MTEMSTEIRDWLFHNFARGCTKESLIAALIQSAHEETSAREWVSKGEQLFFHHSSATTHASANPFSNQFQTQHLFPSSPKTLRARVQCDSPKVQYFEQFLTPTQCKALIDLAKTRLKTSTVVDPNTGKFREDHARTSRGMSFGCAENEIVAAIEQKIFDEFGYSIEQQEQLHLLNYSKHGEYRPHFDYFDPLLSGSRDTLEHYGQRIATFVMYLHAADEGGGTQFPNLNLTITPRAGDVIYFENCVQSGENLCVDPRSLHAGMPVVSGEKWIATKWIRQPKK